MLSRFMRMFLLCVFLLSLASPGFAARRSSLGGNLLIKDTDDVFFLPHRVADYNRLVTFDMGTDNTLGSAGIIFGNESFVFGTFTHRSDFLGQIANAFFTIGDAQIGLDGTNDYFGAVDPPGPSPGPYQWFDFVFGWEGGGNPWGIRLAIGRNQLDQPGAGGDDKNDVTAFDIIVGFEISDIDLAAEFTYAGAKTDIAGTSVDESSPVGFAVAARKTAVEDSDDLQLGWLGMFNYTSAGRDFTPDGGTKEETDRSLTSFVFGAGPVYQPHERTSVSAYGTLEYNRAHANDKTASTKATDTEYIIPGWHIASEIELASWLQARAGVVSRFVITHDKLETTAGEAKAQTSELEFDWHTGLGVQLGDFMFDGYLNPSVLTTGTDLLGNSSQLFGMVTASYAF
ncbi:MAG: hypothetical protein JSW67_00090 [Candidatus Latescibacterota bacterium]|nr:MAG: hypothetical protein JSW67_00090 [Candidatus Latescibacterota bacterium]